MSLLEAAIGWVAPPQCIACGQEGSTLCLGCSTSEIVPYGERCWLCNGLGPGGRTCGACRLSSPAHVWITTSYGGTAKQLIKAYKFDHQRAAAVVLSQLMAETFFDFNHQDILKRLNYLLVPVPTATSRIRQRSFGHSELLARKLTLRLGLQYANALGRLGQSRQVGTKRAERLIQPRTNYFVRRQKLIKNRNILLIDDVISTGATIKAVTKVLRAAGAKRIDALVFAKRL